MYTEIGEQVGSSNQIDIQYALKRNNACWNTLDNNNLSALLTWTEEIRGQMSNNQFFGHNQNPLVSIVIPAYNEELYLLPTLHTLSLQETNIPSEVIVVVNGSNDRTEMLAQMCGCSTVSYQNTHNYGKIAYARQRGLNVARGEIIVSADADTQRADTNSLLSLVTPLIQNAEVTCTTGKVEFMNSTPYLNGLTNAYHLARQSVQVLSNVHNVFQGFQKASGANMAFRKHSAKSISGYDLNLGSKEDTDLLVRLSSLGKIEYVGKQESAVYTSNRRLSAVSFLALVGQTIGKQDIYTTDYR